MSNANDLFEGVIKHSIRSVFDGINERTEKFRKSFDLLKVFQKRHAKKLIQSVAKIQILGMRGSMFLTELYVPTRFSDTIKRDIFIEKEDDLIDITTLAMKKTKEIEVGSKLTRGKSILIHGGPGAGKTTFVSAYVMALLGKCDSLDIKLKERFIPLYFVLRDSPEPPEDLKTLIKQYLRSIEDDDAFPFIERMMHRGDICIILDGLDEIPPENQILWSIAIDKLRKLFPDILIILSCRSSSLNIDFNDFEHFEILPFTKSDSKQFIESWFGETKEETAASLQKDLRAHPRIDELTSTPLLLSLLCNLYENDLELSSNRTDLYSRCIEVLMVRWDTSRGFKRTTIFQDLSISKRRKLFNLLGFHLSESRYMLLSEHSAKTIVGKYIERYDLEEHQANNLLAEMEGHHGLLVKPAANYWCFAHKSLQDFFAAEYVQNTGTQISFLRENWHDSSKWEVLTFVASLLENGDEFVEKLMEFAEPDNLKTFPALGKRIWGAVLLMKCLNQGASLSKSTRMKCYGFLAHSVEVTTKALANTHVFPYGLIINGRLLVSYYYYKGKQRASMEFIYAPLAQLVVELGKTKANGCDAVLKDRALRSNQVSAKLLLASACFMRDPEFMYNIYNDLRSSKGKYVYVSKIGEIADSVKDFIAKHKK